MGEPLAGFPVLFTGLTPIYPCNAVVACDEIFDRNGGNPGKAVCCGQVLGTSRGENSGIRLTNTPLLEHLFKLFQSLLEQHERRFHLLLILRRELAVSP